MTVRLISIVACGLVAGAAAAIALFPGARSRLIGTAEPISQGKALIGGPFRLVDQTGKHVTDADFRGRYMLVFFGFTSCPDVCPSGLQVISAALDKLGPKADKVTPILITIDPERDTPAKLAEYVKSFHPRLVGLTGSLEEVQRAAKAYRVYYKKVADERSAGAYSYDHSSIAYLMDDKGVFVTHFSPSTDVDKLAAALDKAL